MTNYIIIAYAHEREKNICIQVVEFECEAENLESALFRFMTQVKECPAEDDIELRRHFQLIQKVMNRDYEYDDVEGTVYIRIEE